MSKFTLMLAIAAVAGTAAAQSTRQLPDGQADTRQRGQVQSQDAPRQSQQSRKPKRGHSRQQILKQFDTDGDGQLSDAERTAAKAAHEQRRADGRQRMLERFDADGDGQLSDSERREAHQSFQGQRSQGPRGQGDRLEGPRDQDGTIHGRRGQPAQFGDPQRPSREQILRHFDADGDGQLSESERQAAREQLSQRRDQQSERGRRDGFQGEQRQGGQQGQRSDRRGPPPEVMERFDIDGDGRLNETEHRAARADLESRRARAMERFDADGDGRLNDAERRAARDAFGQERRLHRLDSNRDGSFSETELADAFELIRSGDPEADFNGDGIVDVRDAELLINKASDR